MRNKLNKSGIDSVYQRLRVTRPASKRDLRNYVKIFLGLDVPDKVICSGHSSPMDYLWHCFDEPGGGLNGDAVIWANRAGGKTQLAAAATLLDCVFKPGCQVRILAGSGEQAGRMYNYLGQFVENGYSDLLAGTFLKDRCRFSNGSGVEVLTQSARSVRGQHVQKLRCDEIELFDREVFSAAQFITQSKGDIRAAMEILSTMHRPYGLMQEVVDSSEKVSGAVFKWCVWEVVENCRDRVCSQCPLWGDCGGAAKKADGYLKIDDCLAQMQRSSRAGWESEMLCRRPMLDNVVFADFDADAHVRPVEIDRSLPVYRAMDFGFVNPFVCFWIQVDGYGQVRVVDEYVRSRATIGVHAEEVIRRTGGVEVAGTYCDPAGAGVNDVTGTSAVRELRSAGISVRYRRSGILEGIELVRRAIRDGKGQSRLVISPKCKRLIEAMQCYHYPEQVAGGSELPVKDGVYDHYIDALRYFFVNYKTAGAAKVRAY